MTELVLDHTRKEGAKERVAALRREADEYERLAQNLRARAEGIEYSWDLNGTEEQRRAMDDVDRQVAKLDRSSDVSKWEV